MSQDLLELIFKLFLACLLGGIIGLERESVNRPAGFRTHILVSVGATIVMITNLELFDAIGNSNITPDRLGASVISGIGFLGAGTIIRDGSAVKGLTTAASLWTTACIGLALGSGFYTIAILATVFVFLTLEFFPTIEKRFSLHKSPSHLLVKVSKELTDLTLVTDLLSDMKILIQSLKTSKLEDNDLIILQMHIKCHKNLRKEDLAKALLQLDDIKEFNIDGEDVT